MLRFVTRSAMAVIAAVSISGFAAADILTYEFQLTGLQEVPPNASPGIGDAFVTLDTDTNLLSWHIMYSGLVAPTTAAHFHQAPPGTNGGVQVDIGASGPLGGTSGMFMGSATITLTQASNLIAGNWYVNIHTNAFPGGEIRGQVVPAPGAVLLLGLSGLVAARRRRA